MALGDEERKTFLTDDEKEAMHLSAELSKKMRQIIGEGPAAVADWHEVVIHVHNIQHMIMAQAAARAYPKEYRLLGQSFS